MQIQKKTVAPTLNPNLRDFWTTQSRIKTLYGGRTSSKTWDAAGFAVFLASNYKIKFLCTRQFQNRISDSVYTVLKTQIERFGLQKEFSITNTSIFHLKTGSEFLFYGLWRHIDEIKSLEGVDICWIEEAHNLTKEQWDILEPTVRNEGSEFWIIFNPNLITDFVYQRFVVNPPPNSIQRLINYTENPFLSQTMIDVINAKKEEDEDEFTHIYLGRPKEDNAASLIKRSWFLAAIDAHKKLGFEATGKAIGALDVGDSEDGDPNGFCMRKGVLLQHVEEWKSEDTGVSANKALVHLKRFDAQEFYYDSIGVGAGIKSETNRLIRKNEWPENLAVTGWNAAAKPLNPEWRIDPTDPNSMKNKDFFQSLKSQGSWELRKRFERTYKAVVKGEKFDQDELISISSDLPNINQVELQVCQPIFKENGAGKLIIDKKPNNSSSPNMFDAIMMCYHPVAIPRFFG